MKIQYIESERIFSASNEPIHQSVITSVSAGRNRFISIASHGITGRNSPQGRNRLEIKAEIEESLKDGSKRGGPETWPNKLTQANRT